MGACEGQRREGGQRGPEGGRLLGRIRVGNRGLPPRWLPSSACISQGPMCRQAHPRAGWDHWLCLAPGHPVQGKGGCGRKCNTHSTGGHVIEGDVGRWQVGMSPRGRMTRGWKGRWHVVLRHVAQAEALACGRSQHPGTREAFQRTHSAPPPRRGMEQEGGQGHRCPTKGLALFWPCWTELDWWSFVYVPSSSQGLPCQAVGDEAGAQGSQTPSLPWGETGVDTDTG